MFSYGIGDYSGLLLFSFANNKFSHDAAVVIIQMTDRFSQKKEIERRAECSDKGNPLLLDVYKRQDAVRSTMTCFH